MQIKLKKQNNHGKKRNPFLLGGVLIGLLLVICGTVYLYGSTVIKEEALADISEETPSEEPEYDSIETEAVVNQEYLVHTFINQPPAAPASGDKRQVFRILEVIPHDACSIFPYMMEWGSPEEYNKHLPIGYEGLISLAGDLTWMVSNSGQLPSLYTSQAERDRRDYLDNYNVPIDTINKVGAWYRVTDPTVSTTPVSGYFEFVGGGKGMFYIAPTYVAETDSENGIHYKTQAISRLGTANPKGELYVKDPAYYWARDFSGGYPTGDVKSRTDYNYNLSFEMDNGGTYKADILNMHVQKAGGKDYDYLLCVDNPNTWMYGFQYGKGGNYQVAGVADSVELDSDGLYVRIEDNTNKDNYIDLTGVVKPGYFRLYDSVSDGLVVDKYNVKFEAVAGQSGGCYYANGPTLWSGEITESYFQYVGAGKGIYKIPFMYAGADTAPSDGFVRYKESIIEVTDGGGRYALTSTTESTSGSKIPVYAETPSNAGDHKDYAKIITNINFNNVESSGVDNVNQKGVTLGGKDSSPSTEKGGWVFHPISDASEMDITFLSKVHDASYGGKNGNLKFTLGQRIYVKNQTIRYRHYCRKGFISNEIFKLCCYSSNPNNPQKSYMEMVNGVGYDLSKSAEANLNNEHSQKILKDFNANYRIEIEQVTLDHLTPEKVKSANLIYISRSVALEGMSKAAWDNINTNRKAYGQEPLAEWGGVKFALSVGGDISPAALFTIYNECIYERNIALIMDNSYRTSWDNDPSISKNITKLYYLMNFFKEAKDFAKFMPDMYPGEANNNYTKIRGNTGTTGTGGVLLDAYISKSSDVGVGTNQDGLYNIVFNEEQATKGVSNWSDGWESADMKYFKVFANKNATQPANAVVPYYGSYQEPWNLVLKDETKLLVGEAFITQFANALKAGKIWIILQNRNLSSYELRVVPTNAEEVVSADGSTRRWVIYGDEMNPASFDIKYEVLIDGAAGDVALSNTICVLNGGTPLRGEDGPQLNTEYTTNARIGFELSTSAETPKTLDPSIHKRTVTITATDTNGIVGVAEVDVVLRETFDLN